MTGVASARSRAAALKVRRYCSCGRVIVGNPGWASHLRRNPDHFAVPASAWTAAQRATTSEEKP